MRLKESEIMEQLEREIDRYAPLKIKSIEQKTLSQDISPDIFAGTFIEFCIADGPCFKAMVEVKTVATPKIISKTTQQLATILSRIDDKNIVPLLIVPYMGTQQSKMLSERAFHG